MTDRPDDDWPAAASDPDPSSSVPHDEEAPDPAPFDPTGLDLARQIAQAAGRSVPVPAPRGPRKRRQERGRRPAKDQTTRDPTPLGEALEEVIEERGWGTEVNVHLLLGRWPELVGRAVAEHSTPESYADGVVVIRTSSTNWATQLRLMAPQLLARLNASLGDSTIKRLHIAGPQAPSWRKGPRTVQGGRGPRDTYG